MSLHREGQRSSIVFFPVAQTNKGISRGRPAFDDNSKVIGFVHDFGALVSSVSVCKEAIGCVELDKHPRDA